MSIDMLEPPVLIPPFSLNSSPSLMMRSFSINSTAVVVSFSRALAGRYGCPGLRI